MWMAAFGMGAPNMADALVAPTLTTGPRNSNATATETPIRTPNLEEPDGLLSVFGSMTTLLKLLDGWHGWSRSELAAEQPSADWPEHFVVEAKMPQIHRLDR